MKTIVQITVLMLIASLFTGCAMFRAGVSDVNLAEKKHFDADFDATDLRGITQSVADEIAGSAFLGKHDSPPIMMIAGVQNRTSRYVDTKNLTDRVRTLLRCTKHIFCHFIKLRK